MENSYSFRVADTQCGCRLDKFVYEQMECLTRTRIQDLIINGDILVNNAHKDKNYKTRSEDEVTVTIPPAVVIGEIKPENIPINVVYEDKDIVIVNKKRGMVVHPAIGNWSGTLVNALLYHCKSNLSDINGVIRPGIVHRIDKDTSGLLIVAKNNVAHQKLSKQISEHSFSREYETIAHGKFKICFGEINLPIGRDKKNRQKFAVTSKNSRAALTYFRVIKEYKNFSHLRLKLKTGRTHQIRVHLSYINRPVAGDLIYGVKNMSSEEKKLNGQCLHAKYIGFFHPRSEKFIDFEASLPNYFLNFIDFCKKNNK